MSYTNEQKTTVTILPIPVKASFTCVEFHYFWEMKHGSCFWGDSLYMWLGVKEIKGNFGNFIIFELMLAVVTMLFNNPVSGLYESDKYDISDCRQEPTLAVNVRGWGGGDWKVVRTEKSRSITK